MKKGYIALGLIMLLTSCGGHKTYQDDSLYEGDSILIDDNTLLSPDSTKAKADTLEKDEPMIEFSSAADLKEYLRNDPHSAAYSEGIIPSIADYSLDYAQKLVNNKYEGFIIVDKSRMKVILYDRYGREKLNYGMACAKNYGTKHKKADSRTPEGFFSAQGIYDSTDWLFTDDDGKTSPKKGQFGPRFIRLKCPNTSQIGIHGTVAPWSIGHRTSHGCIRVTNEHILELVKHVTIGMPIIVVPGKRDMKVNLEEGYDIPWIPSSKGAVNPMSEAEKQRQKETIASADTLTRKEESQKLHEDSLKIHEETKSLEETSTTLEEPGPYEEAGSEGTN